MQSDGKHRLFVERLLIAAIFALVIGFLWYLRTLLVVVVGSIVIAVLLRAIADPISRHTGLGPRLSLTIAVLVTMLVLGGAIWLFGSTIAGQFTHLSEAIPQSWNALRQRIAEQPLGGRLLTSIDKSVNLSEMATRLVTVFGSAATTVLLIPVGAIFFAAQPRMYAQGLVTLFPPDRRGLISDSLDDADRALRLWLLGQFISMIAVGLLVGLGLWLVGVPSALALGLISGLTEGIPYLGPIVGALPGLLLALVEGPEMALWALGVYLVVLQIEGNTLVPLIHRQLINLPPALTLFWIIAAGLIFGIIGLIFATPMLVVVYVLVKRLYIREALGTHTVLPGEPVEES